MVSAVAAARPLTSSVAADWEMTIRVNAGLPDSYEGLFLYTIEDPDLGRSSAGSSGSAWVRPIRSSFRSLTCSASNLLDPANGDGGVVVVFAAGPFAAMGIGVLGLASLVDEGVWAVLVDQVEGVGPGREVVALDQAGGAVGREGGSGELLARDGAGDGLVGGVGDGAGDPVAAGAVTVLALGVDQAA